MPSNNERPNEGNAFRNIIRRLERLERTTKQPQRDKNEEIAPFSHAAAITVTTAGDEPEWDVRVGGQIVAWKVRLKTAGSSNTVMTFYLNGVSMGTVTLGSGVTSKDDYLGDYRAKSGDVIGARITTAGTGAKGLSAFVTMKG